MIDFYRKSALSQLGKDAGNQTMSDYTQNIINNYDRYLSAVRERKQNFQLTQNENNDFGLYL